MSETKTLQYGGTIPNIGSSADINYQIILADKKGYISIGENDLESSTSLDMYGKKSVNYGNGFWSNLVHLLENFNGTKEPRNPIKGQLWFDGKDLKICTKAVEVNNLLDNATYNSKDNTYKSGAEWNLIKSESITNPPKIIDETFVKSRIIVDPNKPSTESTDKGIIWYEKDTNICRINVGQNEWYDINSVYSGNNAPATDDTNLGKLWFNPVDKLLKIKVSKNDWVTINEKDSNVVIPNTSSPDPNMPVGSTYYDPTTKSLNIKTDNTGNVIKLEAKSSTITIPDARTNDKGSIKYDSSTGSLEIYNGSNVDTFYSSKSSNPSIIQTTSSKPNDPSKFSDGQIIFDTTSKSLMVKNGNGFTSLSDSSNILKLPLNIPSTVEEGMVYYDKTNKIPKYYDGSKWIDLVPLKISGIERFENTPNAAENFVLSVKKDNNGLYGCWSQASASNIDWSTVDLSKIIENPKFLEAIKKINNNSPASGTISINGTFEPNQILSINDSVIDADGIKSTKTYKWFLNGSEIIGQNSLTYNTLSADSGKKISASVSFIDNNGILESKTSTEYPIKSAINNTAASGTVNINYDNNTRILSSSVSNLNDPAGIANYLNSLIVKWYVNGDLVQSGTNTSYTLPVGSAPQSAYVVWSFNDDLNVPETLTSATFSNFNTNTIPIPSNVSDILFTTKWHSSSAASENTRPFVVAMFNNSGLCFNLIGSFNKMTNTGISGLVINGYDNATNSSSITTTLTSLPTQYVTLVLYCTFDTTSYPTLLPTTVDVEVSDATSTTMLANHSSNITAGNLSKTVYVLGEYSIKTGSWIYTKHDKIANLTDIQLNKTTYTQLIS